MLLKVAVYIQAEIPRMVGRVLFKRLEPLHISRCVFLRGSEGSYEY